LIGIGTGSIVIFWADAEPASGWLQSMKIAGFLLLLAGWLLMLSALALLARGGPRSAFLLAGLGVELLGLVLFIRSHLRPKEDQG
jgi:hypothetical protein